MSRWLAKGIVLVLWSYTSIFGQTYRIDSLRNALPKANIDPDRINLLNALAFEFIRLSIPDAEAYANEALRNARQHNYALGAADAFKALGLVYLVKSEYPLAMEYSYKALKLYEEVRDLSGQSKILNNLGIIMLAQKEYGRAYDFSLQSIKIKRTLGDSVGVYNSYITLAEYYLHKHNYKEAHRLAMIARTRFDEMNDGRGVSHALFTLGEIFLVQKAYEKAKGCYQGAIREARLKNNFILIINANKQLGKLYLESGRRDSAFVYLHATLKLAIAKNYRRSELELKQFLANYFMQQNQLDSALYYTQSAIAVERELFDRQKQEQISTMQMLSNFETQDQELKFHKRIVKRQYVAIVGVTLILFLAIVFGFRVSALNRSNRAAKEALIELNAEKNKINENLEALVQERTEELKSQNQKILDYAFFTAHEVRGPLARILGLIELTKIKDLNEEDKMQIMKRLEDASTELDEIIRSINRRLESAMR